MLKYANTGLQCDQATIASGSVTALGLDQFIPLLDERGKLVRQ
jgi:hypothetical protein